MSLHLNIIGTGRVAQHFIKAFAPHDLVLSFSGRNLEKAKYLSQKYQVEFYPLNQIPQANIYLLCCSDSAIGQVSGLIDAPQSLVVHCAGALGADVLHGNYRKAVVYPLQSFSDDKDINYAKIKFFIESSSSDDFDILKNLFNKLSHHIKAMGHQQRQYLHLAAVFACNFSNHLLGQAQQICDENNLDFDDLMPLLEETFQKIKIMPAKQAQTGPAIRHDFETMQKHQALSLTENQLKIYQLLSQSIMDF